MLFAAQLETPGLLTKVGGLGFFLFARIRNNMKKSLEVILAATIRGEIGYNNTIPWRLVGDLRRFKEITQGQTLVMGRNTYESLPRPLLGRSIVVLSRMLVGGRKIAENFETAKEDPTEVSATIRREGLGCTLVAEPDYCVYATGNLAHAFSIAALTPGDKIFIAGGAELYQWALDYEGTQKVHLTTVYKESPNGYDARINRFNMARWKAQENPEPAFEFNDAFGLMTVSHTYCTYVPRELTGG